MNFATSTTDPQQITFTSSIERPGTGHLLICGLEMPRTPFSNPLIKLWTCIRQRSREQDGIDVIACFEPRAVAATKSSIEVHFYLSYSHRDSEAAMREHNDKFQTIFPQQMTTYESNIQKFVSAEVDGLADYVELLHRGGSGVECAEMLNRFLVSIHMRTEADEIKELREQRKKERRARKEQCKKNHSSSQAKKPSQVNPTDKAECEYIDIRPMTVTIA